jgi:hypothetical protein
VLNRRDTYVAFLVSSGWQAAVAALGFGRYQQRARAQIKPDRDDRNVANAIARRARGRTVKAIRGDTTFPRAFAADRAGWPRLPRLANEIFTPAADRILMRIQKPRSPPSCCRVSSGPAAPSSIVSTSASTAATFAGSPADG